MPIPKLVRRTAEKQIHAYCERRVPAHARHQVRLEAVRKVTPSPSSSTARRGAQRRLRGLDEAGIARFRYEPRLGAWSLFWADRHGRWHRYDYTEP